MTFREAQLKLLAYVVDRIHNGELTERGFARLIGISQPHAHNVLKGVRNLSPEIFDSILKYLAIIPSGHGCEVEYSRVVGSRPLGLAVSGDVGGMIGLPP